MPEISRVFVSIKHNLTQQGSMPSMIPAIDRIVTAAIAQRVFPGAVVLVAHEGVLRHTAAYGSTMYADPGSQPVTLTTRYDIASLTKVFTATAVLQLYDAGAIMLDRPAADYLPGLQARGVTVRHLLTHTSGLVLQLSALRAVGADELRAAVYATNPTYSPGTHVAYTNINSMLLGDIVAAVSDQPLDQALRTLLLEPLGLEATGFCPDLSVHTNTAPTEWDTEWRGTLVQGVVHDESTFALGGVAGHAGLFSTATDLWRFAQMWLDQGVMQQRRFLRAATVALATRDHTRELAQAAGGTAQAGEEALRCGLGWMLERPTFMGQAPADTYGHTGFTGPALAIVPSERLIVVVLSNRTYPRRTPPQHHAITAAVLAAAREAI